MGRRRRLCSAAARRETRRTWPNLAVRGSNRPVLGSGVTYRACVVHLGSKRSSGGLGWGSSTARAARWQRGSPGLAWSGPYGAPRANTTSAEGMAGLGLLTKGWSGWGVTQVAPAARSGSGRGWSFAVRAALGSSGLGSPRIKVPRCCRSGTQSGRAGTSMAARKPAAAQLTGDEFGSKIRVKRGAAG